MDYAEPLLELKEYTRKYHDAMKDRKRDLALQYAMKMVKASVDCVEAADPPNVAHLVRSTDKRLAG